MSKLRRMQFGRSSENISHQIQQLELQLEELEAAMESRSVSEPNASPISVTNTSTDNAAAIQRRKLPSHRPRETHTHLPKEKSCTKCGGAFRKLGEDVSEVLEYIPANFKVIRHVRPRLCCLGCERVAQASEPIRPIERSFPGRVC